MALSSEIPLAMRRRLGRSVVIYADVELRAHRKKGVLSELCESNQRDANGKESKRCLGLPYYEQNKRKKRGHGMCHRSSMDNHTLSMYIDHRYQIAWVATSREQAMKNAAV